MKRNAQDIIDDMRKIVKPRIAKMLLETNFEGCGKEDKAEFETEFEMILTLAEKTLEQEPTTKNCESCRHYGLHHEICNYCYKCSLWKEKEPTTKKCITCAYRKIDGKPHEMCKSCVCGNRYREDSTTKNDCAEQNGCISCSLDDGDDCCRKLYEESMQEPTTKNDLGVDCISREAVLTLFNKSDGYSWEMSLLKSKIEKLPSVTPIRSKGHWINKHQSDEDESCSAECSSCHKRSDGYAYEYGYGLKFKYYDFCPKCGSDNREVDE